MATATAFIPGVGPLVSAAVGAATQFAIAIESLFSGCGQTCVQASNIANQVAGILEQNLNSYLSYPIRTASMQAAALQTFDGAWAQLQQACGNPALGQAGQNCISDRQAGGCKWQTSPGGWQKNSDGTWKYVAPGAAGSGTTCWNWFVGYRDPIAQDPMVLPDSAVQGATGSGSGLLTGSGSGLGSLPVLLIGAVVVFMALGGGGK